MYGVERCISGYDEYLYDEYDWTVRANTVGCANRAGLRVLCVHGGLNCVFVKTECASTLCDSGYGLRTCSVCRFT